MNKICTKCKLSLTLDKFSKDKYNSDNLSYQCKSCRNLTKKQNPNNKIQSKIYYQNNKNKILKPISEEKKLYLKQYREKNKEKLREKRNIWEKNKLKNDPIFKLKKTIQRSILLNLKRNSSKKEGSFIKYLPYSLVELKAHLESLFLPWMSWSNHGPYNVKTFKEDDETTYTWNIDHIIPHSEFKYTNMNDEEFKKCWSLENLRPLQSKQNIIDGVTRSRHKK